MSGFGPWVLSREIERRKKLVCAGKKNWLSHVPGLQERRFVKHELVVPPHSGEAASNRVLFDIGVPLAGKIPPLCEFRTPTRRRLKFGITAGLEIFEEPEENGFFSSHGGKFSPFRAVRTLA